MPSIVRPEFAAIKHLMRAALADALHDSAGRVQAIKPIKPIKPIRPVKALAPVEYEYYWKDKRHSGRHGVDC